jgi:hypothetical protein
MSGVKGRWQVNAIKRISNVDYIPTKARDVMAKLMLVFQKHIGEENRISAQALFKKMYRVTYDDVTDLQYFLLCNQLSMAISRMRQETNCFVVRKGSFMWVAKTKDDSKLFKRQTAERIKGLIMVANRCDRAVSEKWYRQSFSFTKRIPSQTVAALAYDQPEGASQ